MAELLGVAASIIQIAGTGAKLSIALYDFIGSASRADREITDIAGDVELTSNVLSSVGHVFETEDAQSIVSRKAIQDANSLITRCGAVFTEISEVVEKRRRVTKDGKRTLTGMGKWTWPLKEQRVELLRRRMESLKSSLVLLLHVLQLAQGQARGNLEKTALNEERIKIRELHQRQQDSLKSLQALETKLGNFNVDDDDTLQGSDQSLQRTSMEVINIASNPTRSPLDGQAQAQVNANTKALQEFAEHDSDTMDTDSVSDEDSEKLTLDELANCAKHVQKLLNRITTLQKELENGQPSRVYRKRRMNKAYRRFCQNFEANIYEAHDLASVPVHRRRRRNRSDDDSGVPIQTAAVTGIVTHGLHDRRRRHFLKPQIKELTKPASHRDTKYSEDSLRPSRSSRYVYSDDDSESECDRTRRLEREREIEREIMNIERKRHRERDPWDLERERDESQRLLSLETDRYELRNPVNLEEGREITELKTWREPEDLRRVREISNHGREREHQLWDHRSPRRIARHGLDQTSPAKERSHGSGYRETWSENDESQEARREDDGETRRNPVLHPQVTQALPSARGPHSATHPRPSPFPQAPSPPPPPPQKIGQLAYQDEEPSSESSSDSSYEPQLLHQCRHSRRASHKSVLNAPPHASLSHSKTTSVSEHPRHPQTVVVPGLEERSRRGSRISFGPPSSRSAYYGPQGARVIVESRNVRRRSHSPNKRGNDERGSSFDRLCTPECETKKSSISVHREESLPRVEVQELEKKGNIGVAVPDDLEDGRDIVDVLLEQWTIPVSG